MQLPTNTDAEARSADQLHVESSISLRPLISWLLLPNLIGLLPLLSYGLIHLVAPKETEGFTLVSSGSLFLVAGTYIALGLRDTIDLGTSGHTTIRQTLMALLIVTAVANAELFGIRAVAPRESTTTTYAVLSWVFFGISAALSLFAAIMRVRTEPLRELELISSSRAELKGTIARAVMDSLDLEELPEFSGATRLDFSLPDGPSAQGILLVDLTGNPPMDPHQNYEPLVLLGRISAEMVEFRIVPESDSLAITPDEVILRVPANDSRQANFNLEITGTPGEHDLVVSILHGSRLVRSMRRSFQIPDQASS